MCRQVLFKDMVPLAGRRQEVKVLHCLHLACGQCLQGILKQAGQERPLCPVCDSQSLGPRPRSAYKCI